MMLIEDRKFRRVPNKENKIKVLEFTIYGIVIENASSIIGNIDALRKAPIENGDTSNFTP